MSYLLISAISKVVSLLYVKSAKASKTTSYRAFFYISGEISDGSTIVDLCLEFQPARYNTNIPNEPPAWKPRFHYVRIAWARAHKKVGNREMHSMVNDAAQKSRKLFVYESKMQHSTFGIAGAACSRSGVKESWAEKNGNPRKIKSRLGFHRISLVYQLQIYRLVKKRWWGLNMMPMPPSWLWWPISLR